MSCPRLLLAILGIYLSLICAAGNAAPDGEPEPPHPRIISPKTRLPAPGFSLENLHGEAISLCDFQGQVVILHFWATWCAPCRQELPLLDTFWQKYRKQGLTVLAINIDRGDAASVSRLVEQLRLDVPVLLDPQAAARLRYEVVALPQTYFIGRDGKFSGKLYGAADWLGQTTQDFVNALLRSTE